MSIKVMIVDDFDIIRFNLKKIIAQIGVKTIVEAVDGVDALQKLKEQSSSPAFDVIFLDWNMPRMNGFDFLVECKKNELYKNIPIIMTTAEREKKSVITALGAGASDYIVKPFKAFIIQEKIDKIITAKKVA